MAYIATQFEVFSMLLGRTLFTCAEDAQLSKKF